MSTPGRVVPDGLMMEVRQREAISAGQMGEMYAEEVGWWRIRLIRWV